MKEYKGYQASDQIRQTAFDNMHTSAELSNEQSTSRVYTVSPRKQIGILMLLAIVIQFTLELLFYSDIINASQVKQLILSTIIVTVASILVPTLIYIFHNKTKDDKYNLNKLHKNQILPCILMGVGLCFSALAMASIIMLVYEAFGANPASSDSVVINSVKPLNFVLNVICVCVAPAVCEELLCRGAVLYSMRSLGIHSAALWSGLYFALLHINFVLLPMYLLLGYVFGIIAYKTRSVYSTMIIHFMYNFSVLLLNVLASVNTASEPVKQSTASIWIAVCLYAVIGCVVFIPSFVWFIKNCRKNDSMEAKLCSVSVVEYTDEYNAICKPRYKFGVLFIATALCVLFFLAVFTDAQNFAVIKR